MCGGPGDREEGERCGEEEARGARQGHATLPLQLLSKFRVANPAGVHSREQTGSENICENQP